MSNSLPQGEFFSYENKPEENSESDIGRDEWIERQYQNFVQPSEANKHYYKAILQLLWPKGENLPGPWRTREEIREAINEYRSKHRVGRNPDKPYRDPFRRLRELQGEEGIVGIVNEGQEYRLESLETEEKRTPRSGIDDEVWERVKDRYGNQCANCGRSEPEVDLEPDHKVPRMRGGGDEEKNWQPLCTECNNWKSTQCRGCTLDCQKCPWAFPRIYKQLQLDTTLSAKLQKVAKEREKDPESLLNEIVAKSLQS